MILGYVAAHFSRAQRAFTAGLLASAFLAPSADARAQADSTWRDHDRALQEARSAHDTVSYRAQLNAVYHIIGASPRIAGRFAALALATHDAVGARRWLGAIAAMGAELDSGMLARYSELDGASAAAELMAQQRRATRDVGAPQVVSRFPDSDMISEDIAYDAARSRFLVSSVRRGSIFAVRAGGSAPAAAVATPDSSWGIFALGVDSARGALWATTAALPMAARYSAADSGRSALLKLDLRTGTLRTRYEPPDSGAHALGDLTIGSKGAIYVSDGVGGGVYALDPKGDALRVLVPRGVLVSPQTPALSGDEETLFVPDYAIGIAAVDIRTGRTTWVAHSDSLALTGIDGMYRVGHDLIVVQNGLEPNRIVRLTLDARMRRVVRATTLVQGALASELTHAALARGWLYFIARSGWDRVSDDGSMRAAASSDGPVVVRVRPGHP